MLVCEDVLTLPIAMLSMRSLQSATVLYSNSYYTVVASIFLVSTASNMCSSFGSELQIFSAVSSKVTHLSNATHVN